MKRLEKILPQWTRVMWASERAAEVWKPRVAAITAAWSEIEKWSVVDGVRSSALVSSTPDDLPELTRWALEHELVAVPLSRVGGKALYSASSEPPGETGWSYRVALCRPAVAKEWSEHWHGHQNDDAIGALLGFPDCCRAFFQTIWIEEKYLDTTWPMAINGGYALRQDSDALFDDVNLRTVKVEGYDECNILLRWLGVRAVAHLPCAFNCPETVKVADEFAQVGSDHGFRAAVDWISEMLSWPIEWSALHGIAEIKTPILKISSRTDMTAEKYVVRREGSSYPVEGSDGLIFPYRKAAGQVELTKTPAFARAFTGPIELKSAVEIVEAARATKEDPLGIKKSPLVTVADLPKDLWTDNGFDTYEAMNLAHDVLLAAAPIDLLHAGDTVLDLGCGNGRLLERLGESVDGLRLYGIEAAAERCRRGGERLRGYGNMQIAIYEGSMFDPDLWIEPQYDLVFFMPGRLLELRDAGVRADTLRGLLRLCSRAVFYAYGDWLEKGGIRHLLQEVGLVEGWEFPYVTECSRNAEAVLAEVG